MTNAKFHFVKISDDHSTIGWEIHTTSEATIGSVRGATSAERLLYLHQHTIKLTTKLDKATKRIADMARTNNQLKLDYAQFRNQANEQAARARQELDNKRVLIDSQQTSLNLMTDLITHERANYAKLKQQHENLTATLVELRDELDAINAKVSEPPQSNGVFITFAEYEELQDAVMQLRHHYRNRQDIQLTESQILSKIEEKIEPLPF